MSGTELDIIDQPGDAIDGLTPREYSFLSRINKICITMAKSKTRVEATREIQAEFNLDEKTTERWIRKAEDYMALGAMDTADEARQMYHVRLAQIFNLAMAHAVRDQVEITTKPYKLAVVGPDGKATGQRRVITTQQTKVKPNALNAAALAIATKVAREMAILTGGRVPEASGAKIEKQINIQINKGELPTVQMVNDLSAAQLIALLGAEAVDGEQPLEVLSEADRDKPGRDAGSGGEEDSGEADDEDGEGGNGDSAGEHADPA